MSNSNRAATLTTAHLLLDGRDVGERPEQRRVLLLQPELLLAPREVVSHHLLDAKLQQRDLLVLLLHEGKQAAVLLQDPVQLLRDVVA